MCMYKYYIGLSILYTPSSSFSNGKNALHIYWLYVRTLYVVKVQLYTEDVCIGARRPARFDLSSFVRDEALAGLLFSPFSRRRGS